MSNLISMVDFVLEQKELKIMRLAKLHRIEKHANFLKQPLELWMFVPISKENGGVLSDEGLISSDGIVLDEIEYNEYQQAKERCLFEGFELSYADWCDEVMLEISNESKKCFLDYCAETKTFSFADEEDWAKTIEDLVKYNLTLTATAKNQIEG